MTTLNESINAKIVELEGQIAAVETKASEDKAALQAQVDEAKTHLTGFVAWLERDVTTIKDDIAAVLAKFGI